MEGLGRVFDIVPTADDVEVNLENASGVTFIGVGASQTYTVSEAQDAAGTGVQTLATVDRYYKNTSAAGAAAWTVTEQTAGAVVTAGAGDAAVAIHVDAKSVSAGYKYVKCASSGAGLVYAVVHDLNVQRGPANLAALAT